MLLSGIDVTSGALLFELLLRLEPVIQFVARRPAPRREDFLSALPNFLERRGKTLTGFCWIVFFRRVALSYSCFHSFVCFRTRFLSRAKSVGKRTVRDRLAGPGFPVRRDRSEKGA
jgi:hypothetical protein